MEHFFRNYYTYTNLIPTDIYPVQYGEEQCEPGHHFGPCVRSNYIIHYVYSGKGTFKILNKEYELTEGQLFLIPPNYSTYYKADSNTPWLYRWVEFNGSMTEKLLTQSGLDIHNPILSDTAALDIGNSIIKLIECGEASFEKLMPHFWNFIYALTKQGLPAIPENISEEYIRKAETYIKSNLHKNVTVTTTADYIGIDRSYLCRLFTEHKGLSPKQYIDNLKMNMAVQYLKQTNISITEISISLGYSDCHAFNKAFKKYYGCSPSDWRKKPAFEKTILN